MMRAIVVLLSVGLLVTLTVNHYSPASNGASAGSGSGAAADGPAALKALLITGGCCHDYEAQKKILSEGISARANVTWTIVHEGGTSRDAKIPFYQKKDWAAGYDVVLHNECFGGVTDNAFIESITAAHKAGLAAVTVHCSTHSYRAATTDEWRKLLGVSSYNHGKKHKITVKNLKATHPIMKAFPETWVTPNGELYNIKKVWETATPLAHGYLEDPAKAQVCFWVNQYGKARVFGTTIGHHNETMKDPVFLDVVTRGLLWACDKLDEEGKAKAGYGKR